MKLTRLVKTCLLLAAVPSLSTSGERPAAAPRDLLAGAIRERRIVSFVYQGQPRTVEPHACGVVAPDGEPVLHGYQIAGGSTSGQLPGWRTFAITKITELAVTETPFDAPRAGYASGRPRLDPVWAELDPAAAP